MMNRARQIWNRTEQQLRQQSAELRQRVADLEQVQAESRRAPGGDRNALQESEDKYRTLVEQSLQGLVVIQDFRIVFANTAFAKISGYAVEELLSLSPEQVRGMVHPEDQALVWGRFRDRLEGKLAPPRYEYRGVRKDGAVRWLEMFSSAVEYNGEAAVQATFMDITERKRTEEALRASEAQYRSLFEGIPVGLYRTTPEGRILDANPALMQMLGCPDRESLLALNVADLYADSEDRKREQALLEQEGMVRGFEVQLSRQCQSEELIWVRDTCRAIQGTDGRVLCYEGSLEDITQRKRSEAEIRRLFEAEQQRRQLAETLRRLSMVLSSTLQPNEVLALILEQLGQVLPYDSASVQRLRDDHLEIVACQGFQEPDKVVGLVFPLNPSFPNYRVAVTKEPLAFEDVTQEYPHFKAESDAYVSDRIRSWLGVPLMVRGEFMGMIAIDRAGVRPYGDGEVQLAMTFASQAAVAMHNARLFEELEARRVYLEGVLRSVPDAVVTLDARHRIVEWNSGAEKLFGYSAEEVLGQDLDDLITNPDILEEAVGLTQVVLSGEDVHPVETTRYREDGSPVDLIVAGSPIMVGDELIGVVAAYTDITERKRAEEALRRSLEETARGQRLLLALSQAAQAVQRARTPAEVYRTTGEEIARLGYRASILTLTDDRAHLALNYTSVGLATLRETGRLTGLSLRGYRFPLVEGGLYHRVVVGGATLFVDQTPVAIEEVLPGLADSLARRLAAILGLQQGIYAPLRAGGEVYGVLVVGGSGLSEAEVPAITAFANQAAIAIENARLLETVTQHRRELQRLSSELVNAQEAERKRISQELHDELGQVLTAIRINLSVIERELLADAAPLAKERVAEAMSLIDQTLVQTRDLALDLRPSLLDDLGLLPTLRWHVNRYARLAMQLDMDVELEALGLEERLAPEMEIALYRIVQEALTNVARHAQATRVTIRLKGGAGGVVTAVIEDDGRGFDTEKIAARDPSGRGAGLLGMRERVASLGGSVCVQSSPGQGTRLFIEIPLQRA